MHYLEFVYDKEPLAKASYPSVRNDEWLINLKLSSVHSSFVREKCI